MRRRRTLLSALVTIAAVAAPATALGATRYASPTGSGGCTTPADACSLATAVNSATDGAQVIALPGTYTLSASLSPPAGVSIAGQTGSRPVINMSGSVTFGQWSSSATHSISITNLDLEATNDSSSTVDALGNAVISHVITNLQASTTAIPAVVLGPGASLVDSVVKAASTGSATAAYGVEVGGSPTPVQTNLINDTVVASGTSSVGVEAMSFSVGSITFTADANLQNVIAHGDGGGLVNSNFATTGTLAVSYSNYNGVASGSSPITDNGHNQTSATQTNPSALFVSPPTDLHERAGSPTIDAGTTAGIESTDLDGNVRSQGAAPDMGAYEFPVPSPALSNASLSPTNFSTAGRKVHGKCVVATHKNRHHKRCTRSASLTLTFDLNIAATITEKLVGTSTGRTVKGKCVKRSKHNRKHKHCQLSTTVLSQSTSGNAGANTQTLAPGKLDPGNYTLTLQASANGKQSATSSLTFTVT